MRARPNGFQLVELVVVLAILAVVVLLAAPPLARFAAGIETRLAAEEIVGALREARAFAIRQSEKVGVKFFVEPDEAVRWALYLDGDGDGVRTNDIEAGIDPIAAPLRTLGHFGRAIRFGFPAGEPPRDPGDPGRRLDRLDDPIRFNRSDIASFSPVEGSTPGSIYLTDGSRLLCVRINNRSSRARILVYDRPTRRWSD